MVGGKLQRWTATVWLDDGFISKVPMWSQRIFTFIQASAFKCVDMFSQRTRHNNTHINYCGLLNILIVSINFSLVADKREIMSNY